MDAPRRLPTVRPVVDLTHVTITVRDLDASTRWYGAVLGLEPLAETTHEGTRTRSVVAPGGSLVIGLRSTGGRGDVPSASTIGVRATDRAHLDELARHVDALGITRSPVAVGPGGSVFTIRDLDGTVIEVLATDGTLTEPVDGST